TVPGRKRSGLLLWKGRKFYGVKIKPLLVATIQRLPHRTIESTLPTPGTVSPCPTRQTPFGPCTTAMPSMTSISAQPAIVVGLVSGYGCVGRVSGATDPTF